MVVDFTMDMTLNKGSESISANYVHLFFGYLGRNSKVLNAIKVSININHIEKCLKLILNTIPIHDDTEVEVFDANLMRHCHHYINDDHIDSRFFTFKKFFPMFARYWTDNS